MKQEVINIENYKPKDKFIKKFCNDCVGKGQSCKQTEDEMNHCALMIISVAMVSEYKDKQ